MDIEAAVGPLAIFLITSTNPVIILRHPYNRIVKWQAYTQRDVFAYWVMKPNLDIRDIEDAQLQQGSTFDCNIYCDCGK